MKTVNSSNSLLGLCACDWQLEQIGEYFRRQLLQSRHRGAFELAYAGFVKMTHTLWRSHIAAAHCLPGRWLSELMSKVIVHDPDDQLCSTRRSAGVPFFVQVLRFKRCTFYKYVTSLTIKLVTIMQATGYDYAFCYERYRLWSCNITMILTLTCSTSTMLWFTQCCWYSRLSSWVLSSSVCS